MSTRRSKVTWKLTNEFITIGNFVQKSNENKYGHGDKQEGLGNGSLILYVKLR
jgi:hypothetical protein